MNINIWLTHNEVDCFSFSEGNKLSLQNKIKDATITVSHSQAEFTENLSKTDIAIVWKYKQEWLSLAPNLKWIITPAAGKDYFEVIPPENIALDYCSYHGELMAETAVGMMLAECRGISYCARTTTEWPRRELNKTMKPFRNSHLVIIGFGNIGTWIARYAKPFGVKITGVKQTLIKKPDFFDNDDCITTIENLDNILPTADHLVLIAPATKKTDNIINAERIKLLKSTSSIYNLGRGNSIDEEALFVALKNNQISSAYLDVFKKEPLPRSSPLRTLPNFYLMPHASAISPNYLELFINEFTERYYQKYD